MEFYVLPDSIPEFYPLGCNVLVSVTTLDGRRVCAKETVSDFRELFAGAKLVLVQLSAADFPPPYVAVDLI